VSSPEVESKDRQILSLLATDGRMSFTDLGKATELSTSAVHQRVKRLEQRGLITGYGATVDHDQLGRPLTAFISITPIDPSQPDDYPDRLKGITEIESCWSVAGEESYILKIRVATPLALEELLARIRAVLRRTGRAALAKPERLEASGVMLETGTREVHVNGDVVAATSTEYEILEYLVRHAGRIVPRDELMAVVCQREPSSLDRSLDVHISRLRRKLADRAALIRTVRGVGYLFCVDPSVTA
jgi:Lrp/AsnC family leucine-responsive transcriptional regulator